MPPLKEKEPKPLKAAKPSKVKAAAKAPKDRPFLHNLFLRAARNHLFAAARADGLDRDDARKFADSFEDDELEALALSFQEMRGATLPKAPGGFLAAILAFIMSPQFAELIAWIMSLFAGTQASVAVIMAKVAELMSSPQPPVVASDPPPADAPPTLVA